MGQYDSLIADVIWGEIETQIAERLPSRLPDDRIDCTGTDLVQHDKRFSPTTATITADNGDEFVSFNGLLGHGL